MTEREKDRAFPGPTIGDVVKMHDTQRCKTCRGTGVLVHRYGYSSTPCPACHGTGRKETSDGD